MMTMVKTVLGIGSIVLGGWTISDAIKQSKQHELKEVELADDFENGYGDIPYEQGFAPNNYDFE